MRFSAFAGPVGSTVVLLVFSAFAWLAVFGVCAAAVFAVTCSSFSLIFITVLGFILRRRSRAVAAFFFHFPSDLVFISRG